MLAIMAVGMAAFIPDPAHLNLTWTYEYVNVNGRDMVKRVTGPRDVNGVIVWVSTEYVYFGEKRAL